MKQIKEQLKKVGSNTHTAGAEMVKGEDLPTFLQKFKDVESLCKAYNSLESEFTKRCQRIKELEGKLEKLLQSSENDKSDSEKAYATEGVENGTVKSKDSVNINDNTAENITQKALIEINEPTEKTADNGTIALLIDDKGGLEGRSSSFEDLKQKESFCGEESESKNLTACDTTKKDEAITTSSDAIKKQNEIGSSDEVKERVLEGNNAGEVLEFFKANPESTAHIGELQRLCGGDFSLSSLQRAYIEILKKGETQKAPTVNESEGLSEAVKLMVIKDYLNSLQRFEGPTLMGGSGVIPMTPPVRPKNIAEAGALAQNIIKIK